MPAATSSSKAEAHKKKPQYTYRPESETAGDLPLELGLHTPSEGEDDKARKHRLQACRRYRERNDLPARPLKRRKAKDQKEAPPAKKQRADSPPKKQKVVVTEKPPRAKTATLPPSTSSSNGSSLGFKASSDFFLFCLRSKSC